jgi:general secretion pathway protein H
MACRAVATMWATGTKRPRASRPVRPRARGFTLVEVCIAVAIMALVTGVMVPAFGGIGRAELRRAARKVGATARQTFNDAALTGRTERMVFNLGDPAAGPPLFVEATDDILSFVGDTGALEEAVDPNNEAAPIVGPFGEPLPPPPAEGETSEAGEAMHALLGVSKLGARAARASFTQLGQVSLPSGVRVADILVEGMAQPAVKGIVRLVFFANGYTQAATIHMEDGDKNMYTVRIEALTGRAIVTEGYTEGLL